MPTDTEKKSSENFKHDHMDLRRIKRKLEKKVKESDEKDAKISKKDFKKELKLARKGGKAKQRLNQKHRQNKSKKDGDSNNNQVPEDEDMVDEAVTKPKQEMPKKSAPSTERTIEAHGAIAFDKTLEIKKIFEDLRKIEGTKSESGQELANSILTIIQESSSDEASLSENLYNYARKHDTSRIIQGILSKGDPNLRLLICNALISKFSNLICVKYANFVAEKMLSCIGTKNEREKFLKKLTDQFLISSSSKLGKIVKDPYGGSVLEQLYSNYSDEISKTKLRANFFGKDFINKCERHLGGNIENYTLVKLFEQLRQDKSEDDKLDILQPISTLFESFLEREALQNSSLIHAAIYDFIQVLNSESDNSEKIKTLKTEFFTTLRDIIPFICHTSSGCQVANQVIWYGTAKDRKVIIKSLQTDDKIVGMCKNKYGSVVILCLLDTVDDTRLLNTSIISKISELFEKIAFTNVKEGKKGKPMRKEDVEDTDLSHAKKIIHYLTSGRQALHKESIRKWLSFGDEISTSKKDNEIRQKEIFTHFVTKIITNFKENSHFQKFLNNNATSVYLSDICLSCIKYQILEAEKVDPKLKNFITTYISLLMHEIESPAGSFGLRWIFKKLQEGENGDGGNSFLLKFIEEKVFSTNNKNIINNWLTCNRGCFALVQCLECFEKHENLDKLKKFISGQIRHCGKKCDTSSKGFTVLKEKL